MRFRHVKYLPLVVLPLAATFFSSHISLARQAPERNAQNKSTRDDASALSNPYDAMAKAQAAAEAKIKEAAALPTPKTPDGHPDLSGYWTPPFDPVALLAGRGKEAVNPDGSTNGPLVVAESEEHKGNIANVAAREKDTSLRPAYKPEFQAKAKETFEKAAYLDPSYKCEPLGVPRMGPPSEIVQTPKTAYFLYSNLVSVPNPYRIIPIDGRSHDKDAEPMANGDAVGHWDGDSLVIDVTNFNEDTWIDNDGSFHDANLHVVERFTRQGNTLRYEVKVEDPTLFVQPFSPKFRTLLLGKPGEHAPQDYPCVEMDRDYLKTNERH